jgi:hypothetical protein
MYLLKTAESITTVKLPRHNSASAGGPCLPFGYQVWHDNYNRMKTSSG